MGFINRGSISDLRGAVRLAVDATVGVTDVVEQLHHTIQLRQAPLGTSRAGKTAGITGFVYRSIRGATRLLGHGLDAGMAPVMALLPEQASNATRDSFVAALNGVYGDHLLETDNPLAVQMCFRYRGKQLNPEQPEALPAAGGKVLLFVHGLCLNDGHWTRDGINHGEALAADLGYTPLYLRYNSGLPIAANGRELAAMLETLLLDWPCEVTELAIVGHSMGGLVARSAYHHGSQAGHDWTGYLKRLVSIGTPHHGAPLERGGNWLDYAMDLSPYTTPFRQFAGKRSAGITDLRHGNITDTDREFVPLPGNVKCYAMAATLAKKPTRIHQRLIGDGLVPVDSALGHSQDSAATLQIPENRKWLGFGTGHVELLGRPEVYAQLRDWFEQRIH